MTWWEPASELYRAAMRPRPEDPDEQPREILRVGLRELRARSVVLARQIDLDLPDYTVHDDTHLDALWPLIDLVAPPKTCLTPSEAFVLGGAILLHDLGLAVSAYPGGRRELRSGERWAQSLGTALRAHFGRAPEPSELETPPPDVVLAAERQLLRDLHAHRARDLAVVHWTGDDGRPRHLIESEQLRAAFGDPIGRIAASHWLATADLPYALPASYGAPSHGTFPSHWTIRPVLLACLLRVADAAHLDARRAPHWVRTHRHLSPASVPHWAFQSRLHQVTRQGDRLVFTGAPFAADEATSWWLCFDALRMVDAELRQVNALLGDRNQPLLTARAVAGVEDGKRLAQYIPTDGWEPIDASVHVSDLARLVQQLGGSALYGDARHVPLRELLQNASDAVLARRAVESEFLGKVRVRSGSKPVAWLEVEDDGVGMTPEVMTGALLDFGKSIWSSSDIALVDAALASTSFESTGEFGIGFFSVFMWADRVEVTSRHFRAASSDCFTLDFGSGLGSRPVLRRASKSLDRPGTRVRLWLRDPLPRGTEALVTTTKPLAKTCAWLAPAYAVDLHVDGGTGEEVAVGADDWSIIDGYDLCMRLFRSGGDRRADEADAVAADVSKRLTLVRDEDGAPIARSALIVQDQPGSWSVLVRGGLRVNSFASRAPGIYLAGRTDTARSAASMLASPKQLTTWSSEQATVSAPWLDARDADLPPTTLRTETQDFADVVLALGGDIGPLRPCLTVEGWLSLDEVRQWAADIHSVGIVYRTHFWAALDQATRGMRDAEFTLDPKALIVGDPPSLYSDPAPFDWSFPATDESSLFAAVVVVLRSAWGLAPDNTVLARDSVRLGWVGGFDVRGKATIISRPRW